MACLVTVRPVFPQSSTGAITGRAQDSSGAVIPGVAVTITSPAMIGGARNAVTDEAGVYQFTLLPVGAYRVSFALPGFKTLNIDGVNVNAGATMTINANLEVSTTGEEVTVTSQVPTIDLQAATVNVNWDTQNTDHLPWGRDLRSLAQMVPGLGVNTVDIGGTTLGGATGTSATTYGRAGGEIVSLDGNQWSTIFGDYQTVEEIHVSTAAKSAEAQNPGDFINMVIKSGGNTFHGAALASYQPGSWQSNNVDQSLINQGFQAGNSSFTHYDDYNFDLGGRIVKDKLWFYTAWSHQYAGQYISGFVSQATGQQAVYLTQINNPTLKISYQLNDKMKLEAFAQGNDKYQPFRGASAFVPLEATQNQDAWTMNGPQVKWNYIVTPTMTFDAAVSRGGYWWPMTPHTSDIRQVDLTTTQTRGAYMLNYQRPIQWQYNGSWSWFKDVGGSHNEIKSGFLGTWNKTYTLVSGYPNQQLYQYRSLPGETNYFLHPTAVQVFDYPDFTASTIYYNSWFINDKVTLNRKLTFSVGLRYDRYASVLPQQGNAGSGPFATLNLFPETRNFPVYNHVVPRLSAAYDVRGDGHLALKASYGRYYTTGPVAASVNPATATTWTFSNWDGTVPYKPVKPLGCTSLNCALNLSSVTGGAGTRVLDSSLRGSWMDEYTLGTEIGLRRDYVIRFTAVRKYDYGGSKVINNALPFSAYTDVACVADPGRNNVASGGDFGTNPLGNKVCVWSVPRSNPNFSVIDTKTVQVRDHENSSMYMAYEGTFNKQYSNGWSFLASYSAAFAKIGSADPQDPNAASYNWKGCSQNSLSATCNVPNWRYNMKFSGQKELPLGLMYSAVYSAISGAPYGRIVQVRNALGSIVNVNAEGVIGHYPWIKLWDNRFSKSFRIGDRQSVEGLFDVFNTLNSNAITYLVTANGANYLHPISPGGIDASAASAVLTARTFRVGVRYKF
jgi:hypothetical protein